MGAGAAAGASGALRERVRFDAVRYATCWEDAAVLCRALGPLEGARCLSIASAGDNALALLAADARSVVAVDSRPPSSRSRAGRAAHAATRSPR